MRRIILLYILLFTTYSLGAQPHTVTGLVVDKDGSPIAGAGVFVRGTTVGEITNNEGKFKINNVSEKDVLSISFIGYTTQNTIVGKRDNISITLLEDSEILDEIVVVGYGTQKKATLTGSVSSVSGENLIKRSVANASVAIQGTMPGVTVQQTSGEPGADGASIRIRGIGSINSSTAPLVLVDGIEMDINMVDMNIVENISVLKDAASASIYGSRASNGVILITTKRGKAGNVKVSYNGYLAIQRPTNLPEPVSAADYLQADLTAKLNINPKMDPNELAQKLKMIEEQRTLRPDNWNRYDTDWKGATISESAAMHNHNAVVSGGSENLRFMGALAYLKQDGLIANNNYDRLNLRINSDATITSWMRLSSELAIVESKQLQPSVATPKSIINKSLYMLPTLSAVRELDGNWGYGKNGDNPTAQAEAGGTKTVKRPEQLVSATLTITPFKNFELQGQYSYRKSNTRSTHIVTPYKVSLKGQAMGQYPADDIVSETWSENLRNYYRLQGNYKLSFRGHTAKLLGGFEAEDNLYSSLNGSRQGFNMGKYYLDNGDASTSNASGGANSWSMASFFGRLNYDFKEKYLLEGNLRYDGSSRFIDSERWGVFPSASLGWVLSKEPFMNSFNRIINLMKLRGSYGLLGNQGLDSIYPYAATIDTGYSYWFDKELSSGVAQTTLSNRFISWEKSKQINVGLDASLWNQKLGVTLDYYIKDMYDMLQTFPLPYYVGMSPAFSNASDMRNKGWEISISHKNKIGEFAYGVTINLSNNTNEVLDLKGNLFTDFSIKEGYPKGGYWGYLTDGYFKDKDDVNNSPKVSTGARPGYVKYKKVYQGNDTDPLILEDRDKVYLGDPFPHYEYSVNLTANWKRFDLTVFFQGVGQRKVMMSGIGLKPFANGANLFKHQMDWWSETNPNAAYPIIVPEANSGDNFVISDKWVRSGAYLRLKNVVIGYTLPEKLLAKIKLPSARFYVSGQNLFTLSNFYKGYDPEVNYGGSLGGEFYPIMQTFTFGIDLKF